MLACGSAKLNGQMNPDAFQKQEQMVPGIAGFFLKIVSHYPRHTRRVEAVTQWYRSQQGAAAAAQPGLRPRLA